MYTEHLKKKLREMVQSKKVTICHIEKFSGVHRYIVSRFLKLDEIGINYENGMALRNYYITYRDLNIVPLKRGGRPKKREVT